MNANLKKSRREAACVLRLASLHEGGVQDAEDLDGVLAFMKSGKEFLIEAEAIAPYDGCFWEKNYWLAKPLKGVILSLYVSSHHWADNKEAVWQKSLSAFLSNVWIDGHWAWEDFRCIAIEDMARLICPDMLARMYERAQVINFNFPFKCHECGKEKEALVDELYVPEGLCHGAGGVAVVTDGVVCGECYAANSCSHCNTYVSSSEEGRGLFETPDGTVCRHCAPKEKCAECEKECVLEHELIHGLCPDCRDAVIQVYAQLKESDSSITLSALEKVGKECAMCKRSLYGVNMKIGGQVCEDCFNKL